MKSVNLMRFLTFKRRGIRTISIERIIKITIIFLLIVFSAAIGIYFHLVLHTDIVYTHFLYVPVVLAGMWWGRKAVLVAALLACIVFSFQLFGIGIGHLWGDVARIFFFTLTAFIIGTLKDKLMAGKEVLRISEKKYRLLIDKSLTGILVYKDDIILFANPPFCELLADESCELLGKSIWDIIYNEDRESVEGLIAKHRGKGYSNSHCECRLMRSDGKIVWVDITSTESNWEGEEAFLINVYSIAEKKEAEKKRRELSELAKKQEEQLVHSTRLAELGEMAASISHELNQPLTGIKNFARNAAYMVENNAGNQDDIKNNLYLISEQVDRASKIINQMRELTRRSEQHFSPLNINSIIQEGIEFLMPQMKLSGVDVKLDLAEKIPVIMGDRVRIEQVFLNLFNNARQAMEETTVRELAVKTYIDSGSDSPVVIEIQDSGIGFTEEKSEKIFAPFYTTKKPGHGTGLGLSISLSIINEHKGGIKAVGKPGKGAVFTIRLPIGKINE